MRKPDTTYVSRALLFDRLTDLEPLVPSEPQPLRALTYTQLLESIRRELAALFNTRCALTFRELLECERSVINYGLSDFTSVRPLAQEEVQLLVSLLERTVTAFEPRLLHPRITLGAFDQESGSLTCHIEAELFTETLTEAVSFPILIRSPGTLRHGQSTT